MTKAVKLCGWLLFVGFLFVIATSLAFYHLVRAGDFRRFLISQLEQETQLEVYLGDADLEMGQILGVTFRNLSVLEPGRAEPQMMAERITARVALWPLLQRQLIFYEIRLYQPKVRLIRDKEGRIPIVEKLLSLSSRKQEQTGLALDLRRVKVIGGEFFLDELPWDEGAVATRVHGIELDLELTRGERLDAASEELQSTQASPHGATVEFTFNGAVERSGERGALRANGRMIFPPGSRDYRAAWWSAHVESAAWPAELLQAFAASRLPVQSVKGFLAPRFQLDRHPAGALRVRGEVAFTRLALDAPDLFTAAVSPGDGRFDFDLDWEASRLTLHRADLQSNEIAFALKGDIHDFDSGDPLLQLTLATPATPILRMGKYLPLNAIPSPSIEYGLAMLDQGEVQVHELAVHGRASDLRPYGQLGLKHALRFDAALRNVSLRLAEDGFLPIRDVQGKVRLDQGVFYFTQLKGNYGRSFLVDGQGKYEPRAGGRANYDFRLSGDVDLAQLRHQLQTAVLPEELARFMSPIQEVGGKGRLDLNLYRSADAPLWFEGKLGFQDARLRLPDFEFTELHGDFLFSPTEIGAENVKALLAGGRIQARLAVNDYQSEGGTFDVVAESQGIKAGLVSRVLLSSGGLDDPGIVRGWVRYRGPLAGEQDRAFTAVLDLFDVRLALQSLLQPVRELSGRVVVDERGIDFRALKGLLAGSRGSFNGRWRFTEQPQLVFDFGAPQLDLDNLLSQLNTKSSDAYPDFEAAGKVTLGQGRFEGLEFADLESTLNIERRTWRLTGLRARWSSGMLLGAATITDRPEFLGVSVEPIIDGVPVRQLLDWVDAGEADISGRANLSGQFKSTGTTGRERKQNLNGSFRLIIEDGTIGRLGIIVQILNLLDLSRWFTLQVPDLTKNGIHFRSITGDFKVTDGVYSTENLFVDSDDLRMTGAGRIDVPGNQIDFLVAVRPFAGLDSVINQIPLIGRGIAAIKNSFLVASFRVRGPIDNPVIAPAPLSTLSAVVLGVLGIPGNIIGLLGEENSGQ